MKKKLLAVILLVLAGLLKGAGKMGTNTCFVAKERESVLQRTGEAERRYSPCSTFKVPLSVMMYDQKLLVDETHPVLPFKPGYVDWVPEWKQDQNPTTWMKYSCVWFSQVLTKKLGMKKFRDYVAKFDYGNQDLAGDPGEDNGLTNAWLASSLTISADEQVTFLQKLVDSRLPASQRAQQMTRNILFLEDLPNGWKLYGKTGSGPVREAGGNLSNKDLLGWCVGWAQKDARTMVFACHEVYPMNVGLNAGKRAKETAKTLLEPLLA